jgi:hypothetical protein
VLCFGFHPNSRVHYFNDGASGALLSTTPATADFFNEQIRYNNYIFSAFPMRF